MPTNAPLDDRVKRVLPWLVAVGLFMENLDISILNTAVPPLHALALVRQMLALNGDSDRDGGSGPAVPAPSATTSSAAVRGFPVRIDDYQVDGRLAVRVMNIGGLGHAWSGAQPGPRFGEPAGPDATAAIMDFFGLKGPG